MVGQSGCVHKGTRCVIDSCAGLRYWEEKSCALAGVQLAQLLFCMTIATISCFEPSCDIMEKRYLKIVTVSRLVPLATISEVMPCVLFVISLVFSTLISMSNAEVTQPSCSDSPACSSSCPASSSTSSESHRKYSNMANTSLKLYYFDGKCRAEVARLILTAAGKEFEDIRFNDDDWPKYKPQMPFGQAPVLEMDGKKYAQSLAINTFLAREFGFYGDTNLECLRIDQLVQLVEDLMRIAIDVLQMPDGAEKEQALKTTKEEKSPKTLGYLERLLNESGTGYFVGNKLTLADLTVFDVLTGFLKDYIDFNESYPSLQKFLQNLLDHEKLGPYLATRSKSDF